MKIRYAVAALAFVPLMATSVPVTSGDASTAVGNWLSHKPQLGCKLGASVASTRTCATTNGALFHVVKLAGGGFVDQLPESGHLCRLCS